MQFNIEKYVSNFVRGQFPQFYDDEGDTFVLFLKAYYEWLESQNDLTTGTPNPIGAARNLLDYRDIDNTLDAFLEHFQQKYLYGIPFDIIINKRFLLKNVFDVYRSKGSIQCYKLLFKLIYNQDVDIYLPKNDILKASDGTWYVPHYIEVNNTGNLAQFIGQTIVGLTSGTTAVVEDYISQTINNGVVSSLYISNITPNNGSFLVNEKVVAITNNTPAAVAVAPIVLGSMNNLTVTNGGQNFNVGDILKIANYDIINNTPISHGLNGLVRVTGLTSAYGSINFVINNIGFGYMANADISIYNSGVSVGNGASFQLGPLSYLSYITYNTDLLCDYLTLQLGATAYNLPGNAVANLTSVIGTTLSYQNSSFGSIASLTNIFTGNNYATAPYIFISSSMTSNTIPGTLSYSPASNTITGSGTTFTTYFTGNSEIVLIANTTYSEKQIIKTVTNATSIILYGPPGGTAATGTAKVAATILPSNFIPSDPVMLRADGTVNGNNAIIASNPSTGNTIVATTVCVDSGKGYITNENIKAYRYNCIATPTIVNAGNNYTNNDTLSFIGGGAYVATATGYVTTNTIGCITSVLITPGSNYSIAPKIVVNSNTGSGAILTTSILQYDTTSHVEGSINKVGIGKGQGYWTTTRGFLNADKYIQDSYFYQAYSYQIKAASTLDKYKSILYSTFHPAGSEMFGEFLSIDTHKASFKVISDQSAANTEIATTYYLTDSTLYTVDNGVLTVDTFAKFFNVDTALITIDNSLFKADYSSY